MRLHRSERLQAQWYGLPAEVRAFIELLKRDPRPPGIMLVPERPGYYEEFVGGVWIGWMVDDTGSETVIRVALVE